MNRTRTGPPPVLLGLVIAAACCLPACGQFGGQPPAGTASQTAAAADSGPADSRPPVEFTEEPTTAEATTAQTAATIDPCSLVTRQEAEQLAGTPLDEPLAVRDTCTWTGPVTGPTAQVEVFVGPGAKKYLDIEREIGHELRPLAGIGDEAYAEDEAVFVNKAGRWVSIRLVRLNDPQENRKPLEDLARTVATRL